MEQQSNGLVVKANTLVEASYRLDLVEQRIILAAIVEARETQCGLGDSHVTISAKRFATLFGMEEGSVYGQLKDALETLYNRSVGVRDIDPESGHERVSKVRWISKASYVDGAGAVQLRFSSDMVPYITRLESEFTTYRLERIGRMSSAHAVRLYELLVQFATVGEREIEVVWLKETLGLKDGEYKNIGDFKRWVVDVAVAQINEHSDLRVSYEQRKTGRTVTHLKFSIKLRAEDQPAKAKKAKREVITREFIERNARPGESYDQAYRRLLEERGQQRLSV